MIKQWIQTLKPIRSTLFTVVNKEFLIFSFFLAVSSVFWMLMTLNETYEWEYKVPVTLTETPKNAIITTPPADTITLTLRDKGFTLMAYRFGNKLKPIELNFNTFADSQGSNLGTVSNAELQKLIYQQLFSSTHIVQIKPDKLSFYFNYGNRKIVPVQIRSNIVAANNYYIARIVSEPSKVVIYASNKMLDSIQRMETLPIQLKNVYDTTTVNLSIRHIAGVKTVPDRIKLHIYPDVLTEGRMEVPVKAVNMPQDKVLRTFPQRVYVHFVVGVSQYRLVKPEQFSVIVDYNELQAHPSEKCRLRLKKVSQFVTKAALEVDQADYLIEQP